MGSFVPARHAHIGVVDRLFSRVGAADDLARGRSTFMVEMVETAAILNQAGERALVILDEIGRGTATFDGLSIAWATVEHLHGVNKCRALFATHFHELTALAGRLDRLHNATVRVKEWQGEVVFLHEVVAGAADRSYGIQVAKLAGLPASVIERAKVVLAKLEQEDRAAPKGFEDLPLFAVPSKPAQEMQHPAEDLLAAALVSALAAINPDDLSPREAMDALYMLESQAGGDQEVLDKSVNFNVMAGLVTASRVYPTCGTLFMRKSGKPDFRCHPRLWCCKASKTWMPGIKPGMTGETHCLSIRHGRACPGHPRLYCCGS